MTPTFDNVNEFWWIRWNLTGDVNIARVVIGVFPFTSEGSQRIGASLTGTSEIFYPEFGFEWICPVSFNSIPASNNIKKCIKASTIIP